MPSSPFQANFITRGRTHHLLSAVLSLGLLSACVTPPTPVNAAPVADATAPRNTTLPATITLDGTASRDPDGTTLTYQWSLLSAPAGSRATISGATTASPRFTPDLPGEYVFSLVVSDGSASSTAQVTVHVAAAPATTTPPTANAGADATVTAGQLVTLDGSGSRGPQGQSLTYAWSVLRQPAGSAVTLAEGTAAKVSFTPRVVGEYEFSLLISNGTTSATDTVIIKVQPNQTPSAVAGDDTYTDLGETLTLSGAASSDPEGQPLTYTWSLAVRPGGSAAILPSDGVTVQFKPDVEGAYRIDLTVSDGLNTSRVDSLIVEAGRPIQRLSFRPVDAEYSRALDRMVMVSSEPAQLHVYDPEANTDTVVNLLLPPSSVSVSPDGRYAAVGHDAHISYVDLVAGRLLKTFDVSADVLDIVLAGNGYVYAFPRRDQWETIRAIDLATGQETRSGGMSIYAGTVGKLHPNGKFIYGANNGLSPSDIEKYDIQGGTPTVMYDSPYHGDYSMCGNLWMSEDGARIFTRCGNVFRSSETRANDMTYNGSLKVGIRSLDHSAAANLIAVIPEASWNTAGDDSRVKLFGYDYLTSAADFPLPKWKVTTQAFPTHGKFVFFNKSGTGYYVVLQADNQSGALQDFGVVKYAR